MTDPTALRTRVLAGETTLGTFLNLGSPMIAEICGRAGFDWLLIDLEHGAGAEATLIHELHAASTTPATPIVRVDQLDRLRIARALDLGARGIMVPRVDTPEQAAEAIRFLRYPPSGIRGVALMTRGAEYTAVPHEGVAELNASILGIVQVETPLSVANVDALAAIDGVDVLFVGPTDLTHSLGIPGRLDHPEYRAAIATVGRAARAAGKAAGVLLWKPEDADAYRDEGYTFFALASDGSFVAQGAASAVSGFRSRVG